MYGFDSNNYKMLKCGLYSVLVFSISYFTCMSSGLEHVVHEKYILQSWYIFEWKYTISHILSSFEINSDIFLCLFYIISSNASCKTFTAVLGH